MAKRKKFKQYYNYDCTLTGESFKVTKKAASPDDLVSVAGFYELNPELNDLPEKIKLLLQKKENPEQGSTLWLELLALGEAQREQRGEP